MGQWQVVARLLCNPPPLNLYPLSVWKVSVFSLTHTPPPPSSLICIASVGWYNIMSVGEGMACLSAPGGLPTHSLKEKAIRPEYHAALLFSCFSFTLSTTMVPRLCGTALFVFTHTPTNAQRVMVRTKTEGGCKSVFSLIICLFYQTLIRNMGFTCICLFWHCSNFPPRLLISQHLPSTQIW